LTLNNKSRGQHGKSELPNDTAGRVPPGTPLPPGKYRARTASSQARIGRTRLFASACGFKLEGPKGQTPPFYPVVLESHSPNSSQWRGGVAAVIAVMELFRDLEPSASPIEVEILTLQKPIADIVDGLATPKADFDLWQELFSLKAKLEGQFSIVVTVRYAKADKRLLRLKKLVTAAAVKAAKKRAKLD
jgi:hypothetical protein